MSVDLSKAMNARQTRDEQRYIAVLYREGVEERIERERQELDRQFLTDCLAGENGLTIEDYEEAQWY